FLSFPRRAPAAGGPHPAIVFVTCRARHHFVVDPLAGAVAAAGVEPRVLSTPVRDPELSARIEALEAAGVRCGRLSDYLPAGEARGVPCLFFSGTLLMSHDRYEFLDVADRLLVIGPPLRDGIVREQSVSPNAIAIVGDPRSNAARMVEPARLRAEVVRDLGLVPDRPL